MAIPIDFRKRVKRNRKQSSQKPRHFYKFLTIKIPNAYFVKFFHAIEINALWVPQEYRQDGKRKGEEMRTDTEHV